MTRPGCETGCDVCGVDVFPNPQLYQVQVSFDGANSQYNGDDPFQSCETTEDSSGAGILNALHFLDFLSVDLNGCPIYSKRVPGAGPFESGLIVLRVAPISSQFFSTKRCNLFVAYVNSGVRLSAFYTYSNEIGWWAFDFTRHFTCCDAANSIPFLITPPSAVLI